MMYAAVLTDQAGTVEVYGPSTEEAAKVKATELRREFTGIKVKVVKMNLDVTSLWRMVSDGLPDNFTEANALYKSLIKD